jgi:hypothetical protein
MASERISDGLGGFVVEGSAALSILIYLAWLWMSKRWNQTSSGPGGILFGADGYVRRSRNDFIFPVVPEGRATVGGADDFGRGRGDHGGGGNPVLQGAGYVAAVAGNCFGIGRVVPPSVAGGEMIWPVD